MHTFGETGAGVPAFLAKLWRLVDDPETNNLICWSKDGRSFIIQNQAQFARELLPLNYKHNNMASFIRQLNMYGFHKITSIDNGGLKFDKDEMEFSHPCFKRNCPYLLEHIKRKIASSKSLEDKSIKPEAVSKVLQDVKAMRGRQDSLDSRFSVMKQENEALWREIASLRQKHAKQQQIVNKLIQFLITIVQPTRNVSGVKRHMQLMINDTPENACTNLCKTNEQELDCGPVIHELGEELLEEVADTDSELTDTNSPYNRIYANYPDNESPSPNIEQPHSNINLTSQNYDINSNQSMEDALNAAPSATYDGSSPFANSGLSIIQSVNPDGSKIVYHVTEVPETQSHDVNSVSSPNYNEDNVLTTPMVRKEMLKEKNRGRRKPAAGSSAKLPRLEQKMTQKKGNTPLPQIVETVNVKTEEQDLDPIMFLNAFNDNNQNVAPSVSLLSPNVNEDSLQSETINSGLMGVSAAPVVSNPSQMFISNNFISDDMPTNLFEESSFLGVENSNIGNELESNPQHQPTTTATTLPSGKFSSYIASSNGGGTNLAGEAATSSVSPLTSAFTNNTDTTVTASTSGSKAEKKNENMAVTKYKDNGSNQNVLRLSTVEEVNGHLDSMQDELETLKDLLRGDGYSLDANTLMGVLELTKPQNVSTSNNNRIPTLDYEFLNKLFNDSDILGPYGLSLPMEASLQKSGPGCSGSELMSYQPLTDLSDIIHNKDLDTDAVNTSPDNSQILNSTLNTPIHE